jgi:hypothetical protein
LDARGSAAAGRKLTLEQGLGADFFSMSRIKAGIAPCPWLRKDLF